MKIQKPYLLLRTALLLAFFTDFVTNAAAQCSLTCLGDAQISLSANDGTILVMPDPLLADPYLCTGFKTVEILDSLGNVIATSPLINASYVGQTLTARVTHPASGNSCTTNIRVEDQSAPTLTCRDTTILCSVLPDTANAGVPSIFENTGQSVTLTFEDVRQEMRVAALLLPTLFARGLLPTFRAT